MWPVPTNRRITMRWPVLALTLALPLVTLPAHASAQAPAPPMPALRNVVSANPFLLIATWFNAEYERAVSGTTSVGVRASSLDLGDDGSDGSDIKYYSGRAFWRYYPTAVFEQFYFGLDLGITSLRESGDTHTVLGAGFELGYNWLLGQRHNFYISIGAGADRLFSGDLGDASAVIPTVRIVNIGLAF